MTTLGELLRRYTLQQLEVAQNSLSEKATRRNDGIHQARTAMRKVRAAIALGRRKLGVQGGFGLQSVRVHCVIGCHEFATPRPPLKHSIVC